MGEDSLSKGSRHVCFATEEIPDTEKSVKYTLNYNIFHLSGATKGASVDTALRIKEPTSDGKNAKSDDSVTPLAGTASKKGV